MYVQLFAIEMRRCDSYVLWYATFAEKETRGTAGKRQLEHITLIPNTAQLNCSIYGS